MDFLRTVRVRQRGQENSKGLSGQAPHPTIIQPRSPATLLGIPKELRLTIFGFIFEQQTHVALYVGHLVVLPNHARHTFNKATQRHNRPSSFGLLGVCHQIRGEAHRLSTSAQYSLLELLSSSFSPTSTSYHDL